LCAEVAIQSPAVVYRNILTPELNHGRSQKIVTPEFQEEADYRSCGAQTHAFIRSEEIECPQSRSTPAIGIPTSSSSRKKKNLRCEKICEQEVRVTWPSKKKSCFAKTSNCSIQKISRFTGSGSASHHSGEIDRRACTESGQ